MKILSWTCSENGTLYVGVTSNLAKKVWQHKKKLQGGFTRKYSIDKLVYYECFENIENIENAIQREKRLKRYNRSWKMQLIEKDNLLWKDLFDQICA